MLAFCGALCYAELGAAMPQAGGEYRYLHEAYGPMLGFMSAFVSLTAGFSAPVAAAAKGLARYSSHFLGEEMLARRLGWIRVEDVAALAVVWLLVLIHARGRRGSFEFNDAITVCKVLAIVAVIVGAFAFGSGAAADIVRPAPARPHGADLLPMLATSLVFVMFCYSGWNASAYVASEMRRPQRDLPRSLLYGTLLVTVLYLALNVVYFFAAGVDGLAGEVEVGLIAARRLFGPTGVGLVSATLMVSILASASAMTIAGPRVYFAFGTDFRPLRFLARVDARSGAPRNALLLQGAITSLVLLTGRIDQIQQYAGLTLSLFLSLAIAAVFILRRRRPEMPRPFRVWGYPWPPIVFLVVSTWMMLWALRARPLESLAALATVLAAGFSFLLLRRLTADDASEESELR